MHSFINLPKPKVKLTCFIFLLHIYREDRINIKKDTKFTILLK